MARMTLIRPVLASNDLARTRAFYETELNFKMVFTDSTTGDPSVIEMEYGACKILFFKTEESCALSGSMELFVDDIVNFHSEINQKGAYSKSIDDYFGGARCIKIRDPNGYDLSFVEPLDRYKKFFGMC